jgi:hypothetical protein
MAGLEPQLLLVGSALRPLLTKTWAFIGTTLILQAKNWEGEQANVMKMGTADCSETLVHLYQTTWSNISKTGDLQQEKQL